MDIARIATVAVIRLFDDPEVPTPAFNPWREGPWYSARAVCAAIGCAWKGEPQTLKHIPEHHKAILLHEGTHGPRNLWCLSATGAIALHCQITGGDPTGLAAGLSAHGASIPEIAPEKPEPATAIHSLLADARTNMTPLRLMLVLDELPCDPMRELIAVRSGAARLAPVFPVSQDLLALVATLPADEQRQVDDYLDWRVEASEALSAA
jgi:hypothetical protein